MKKEKPEKERPPEILCAHCRQMIPIPKLDKHITKDHGEEKRQGR